MHSDVSEILTHIKPEIVAVLSKETYYNISGVRNEEMYIYRHEKIRYLYQKIHLHVGEVTRQFFFPRMESVGNFLYPVEEKKCAASSVVLLFSRQRSTCI